jgi:hypothetical protein
MFILKYKHFKTFNFYIASVGEKRLKYLLDLTTLGAEKLPGDGTLTPKHVGVGI